MNKVIKRTRKYTHLINPEIRTSCTNFGVDVPAPAEKCNRVFTSSKLLYGRCIHTVIILDTMATIARG